MPNYFALRVGRDWRPVECSDDNDWASIHCVRDPGHQRAGRRTTELRLDLLASRIPDFSTTMLSDVVITPRTLMAMRQSRLTGYREVAARIVDRPGTPSAVVPHLWEFIVTG